MLTPVGEHELLLFWIQLVLLLGVARVLGRLMTRFGQPAVVGELGAGLVLGPSVLGRLAPGLAGQLFPGGEVESALLLAVSWLGIVLLLAVTGFETDLALLRRLGRPSAAVSVGSLVVPLAGGYLLGMVLPSSLIGEAGGRPLFAAFLAVALSISALPVVAKILQDMQLMRRDFGQITVAAGMVNDLVGWLLLGTLIGAVQSGGFDAAPLALTVAAIAVFVVGMLTVGQRTVDSTLRRVRRQGEDFGGAFTFTVLVVLAAGAVTHAIGMEAVIGAFVAGIVLGRSRYLPDRVRHALEGITNTVFAPIFFATAGLFVDLGSLAEPANALAAVAVLAVAGAAKLGGSFIGARLGRLSTMEGLAIGVGLNARGAMEIVLATVGLRLQVLNEASYTAVVLMAMATSLAAPPLLKPVLRRLESSPEESERLAREELLASSVIANAQHALLPTRGGANSLVAGRTLDLLLQPEASVTVLTARSPREDGDDTIRDRVALVRGALEHRRTESRDVTLADGESVADAILAEAGLGYDLLAVGLNEEFRGTHRLSDGLQRLLAETAIPVLLVRRPARARTETELGHLTVRRILVPVTGTPVGTAAEEIAYVLARRVGAQVDAVHVLSRTDATTPAAVAASGQLRRSSRLAERFGHAASAMVRTGPVAYEELLTTATERGTDLIVLGAQLRSHDGRPFLGHGTEHLLEHADPAVAVVVFPARTAVR